MSGFPWTTLITASAPVVAALGAVWLKEQWDTRRENAKAQIGVENALHRELQDTYARVARAARSLAAARRYRDYAGFDAESPEAKRMLDEVMTRTPELHKAIGSAEVIGPPEIRDALSRMRRETSPGAGATLTAGPIEEALKDFLDIIQNTGRWNQAPREYSKWHWLKRRRQRAARSNGS
jgi:hypothetical protein